MASFKAFTAAALAGVLASAQASFAAEGGFSFYLPGAAGDIALAQSSEPGQLQVANSLYVLSGDVGAAVLQGKANVGLDLTMVLDIVWCELYVRRESAWCNLYGGRCDPLRIRGT